MLQVDNDKQTITITINEGDFGYTIPFNVKNGNILDTDTVLFIIENASKEVIISEEMTISNNHLEYVLTEEDTNKLDIGRYNWGILQQREGVLVDTIEINNKFIVERGLSNGS